jgi:hypothetical protein
MTLFNPSVFVNRLIVMRDSHIAYEASFHEGVNIITGENSSGKSTVLSLLIFGLGGDVTRWSEQAALCHEVLVEAEFNGAPVVLRREISTQPGRPMDIFFGRLSERTAAPTGWTRYPYRSSDNVISFSQQLFGMLNLPELQTEVSGKITMHQLLRLHYSDQLASIDKLFRDETFDSPDLREAVGRLLFGAYENEIYRNQLKIRDLKSVLANLNSSMREIYRLISDEHALTLDWVQAERHQLGVRRVDLERRILELEAVNRSNDELSLQPLERAREYVGLLQEEISEIDRNIEGLQFERADSEIFIDTIEQKLKAVEDTVEVSEIFGEVRYTNCPVCFAELEPEPIAGSCHLCQQPFDREKARSRILAQLAGLRKQLKQSRELQLLRDGELAMLAARRAKVVSTWDVARKTLEHLSSQPTSELNQMLRELYQALGGVDQELVDLGRQEKLIAKLDKMSRSKEELASEITALEDANERLLAAESEKISRGIRAIEDEIMWFLKKDLPRQDTFQDARAVNISFEKDSINVNGVEYFSASSKVFLKNSFIAGFLFASLRYDFFRHLRLIIIDTIEDKGMEVERSQNFQSLLAQRSSESQVRHQIIFATSMISSELDNDKLVVGGHSTHESRTLKVG